MLIKAGHLYPCGDAGRPQRVAAKPVWLEAGTFYPIEVRYGAASDVRVKIKPSTAVKRVKSVDCACPAITWQRPEGMLVKRLDALLSLV